MSWLVRVRLPAQLRTLAGVAPRSWWRLTAP